MRHTVELRTTGGGKILLNRLAAMLVIDELGDADGQKAPALAASLRAALTSPALLYLRPVELDAEAERALAEIIHFADPEDPNGRRVDASAA